MKEVLYKNEHTWYESIKYKDCSPIDYCTKSINRDVEDFGLIVDKLTPTKKYPLYLYDKTERTKEDFSENFFNPLYSLTRQYYLVVVEKYDDKVSIKTFRTTQHRKVGVKWYKTSKRMDYITVNTKTGDVYVGTLTNYHLKKKCKKTVRRNYFINNPLSGMLALIKHNLSSDKIGIEALEVASIFMNEIDQLINSDMSLTYGEKLFKYYLTKRGVKFPNNFSVFTNEWFGPDIRKCLKKKDNRMVDAIMMHYDISGKQVKKALHNCKNFNVELYKAAQKIFGDDWITQEPGLILGCFNFELGTPGLHQEFLNYVSNEELKRVFKVFKKVVLDKILNLYTFYDHIRMYTELKILGETNLKWMSSNDDGHNFRQEHLDWTEMLAQYRNGVYERTYPDYSYNLIENPIQSGNDTYYPLLLKNSNEYNEESSTQSNCVKGYIDRCASIIVSLRKDDKLSGERATIEYTISKPSDEIIIKRVQSLGRFNNKLSEEWNDVLFKLDEVMLSYVKDEKFETVKLDKVCKNGQNFHSNSKWGDRGHLIWENNEVTKNIGRQLIDLF